jgi:GDPmannose 4,6-dehydratase
MSEARRALITGIGGQDGSYLAEFLVNKGYEVHGIDCWGQDEPNGGDANSFPNLAAVRNAATFHRGDLRDPSSLRKVVQACRPHEVYNLAAVAFVPDSFQRPELVLETNAAGVTHLLKALREADPEVRFFQASSSEMFGKADGPQDEKTPFEPVSPYGESKAEAHRTVVKFRDTHGMYCCCGISFNHESRRRDVRYVTRKVTTAAAKIRSGMADTVLLGNLEARRDWGYAPEYVEAMWSMLAADSPGDYVLATGRSYTVREMAELAFDHAGLRLDDHLELSESLKRPIDPHDLTGNAAKAKAELGWEPKTDLPTLIRGMVDADLATIEALA